MKRTLIATATAVAALAAAPGASAAVDLTGGSTTLKLDRGTAAALDGLGVSVAPVGRARAGASGVRFPITGGRIDARTAAGTIRHAGGLRFSAGGRSLTLRSPRVAVGRKIMLSARVGGGRVHLLELTGARVSRSGFNTNVSGLRARLTQKAASALNATFGVKAFKKGLRLGTASVRSRTDEADILARSATSLEIDPGALQALTSLGIAPGVIAPATLAGTTAAFPISGGRVKLDLSARDDPPPRRHLAHQGRDRRAAGVVRRPARRRARSCSRRSTAARRRRRSSTSTSPASRRRSTAARSRWPASRRS